MNKVKCNRKRQARQRHTALYIAPSKAEYVVEVLMVAKDGSAQVVYEWTQGKFARMWVGANDLSGAGVR